MMLRLATFEDLEPILALLERFHEENGIFPLSLDKTAERVVSLISAFDLFLVEKDGIAGILGIVQYDVWYADASALFDQFFYVAPEHRGGDVGKLLMKAAAAEAERRGMPLFISVTNPGRKRGRVATTEGYFPVGHLVRLA
jgi:GNAT superfamily N-acetyltransferase